MPGSEYPEEGAGVGEEKRQDCPENGQSEACPGYGLADSDPDRVHISSLLSHQ